MIRKISFIAFIIFNVLILYFSNQPKAPDFVKIFSSFDKVLHFCAYYCYGLLLRISLYNKDENSRRNILLTIIISCLFAISDEIHQSFVPGRDASILDIIADFLGIFVSLFVFNFIIKYENFRKAIN